MRTLFAPLLLIGILWMARWWILAVLAAIVVGLLVWLRYQRGLDASSVRRRERAALVARADQQHAWVLAGDNRGVYGEFAPAGYDARAREHGTGAAKAMSKVRFRLF